MSSEDLEYRAKLVELIYSSKRDLLHEFAHQAGCFNRRSGHSLAANRIMEEFAGALSRDRKDLSGLPIEEVQSVSLELFLKSNEEMRGKYGLLAQ